VVCGLLIYLAKTGTLRIPGARATDIAVVCYAIPGALLGIAAVYGIGVRQGQPADQY